MSFHFTQFCAFISYSFVFMGYYLWFIVAKVTIFRKCKGFGAFFRQLSILPLLFPENPYYYSVIRNNMNSFATIGYRTDRFMTDRIINCFRPTINKNTAH